MMARFCRYIEKVFDFAAALETVRDSRKKPQIPAEAVWTLFIAFVLLQTFYLRNLKPPLRARFTLIAVASQIYLGLVATISSWRAPWCILPQQQHLI